MDKLILGKSEVSGCERVDRYSSSVGRWRRRPGLLNKHFAGHRNTVAKVKVKVIPNTVVFDFLFTWRWVYLRLIRSVELQSLLCWKEQVPAWLPPGVSALLCTLVRDEEERGMTSYYPTIPDGGWCGASTAWAGQLRRSPN